MALPRPVLTAFCSQVETPDAEEMRKDNQVERKGEPM
ncbi:hypothetical protein Q644_16190 [Brucella intermedia 229E]|uniref:Uncharacterized protein n=1 Tax=Brucella intermedia 229E TaxID=1337887 RepID=U4VDY1_9HYPH|nr:hypothetical protein Q644_16190 [Brucella intermedia 229E]